MCIEHCGAASGAPADGQAVPDPLARSWIPQMMPLEPSNGPHFWGCPTLTQHLMTTPSPAPQVRPRVGSPQGILGSSWGLESLWSVHIGTLPASPAGPGSPPLLPTAWATLKQREDHEVRGQRRGGGGAAGSHLGPDSFPSSRTAIILPWSSSHPQGARKCSPVVPRPSCPGIATGSLTGYSFPPQMGACFSKVFNGCPLQIHAAVTWVHPVTRGEPGVQQKQ